MSHSKIKLEREGKLATVSEVRVRTYDDDAVNAFIVRYPFYQNQAGVVVPTTRDLIFNYFSFRSRHGPLAIQAKFKAVLDSMSMMRTFVPVMHDGKEEWIPSLGAP